VTERGFTSEHAKRLCTNE